MIPQKLTGAGSRNSFPSRLGSWGKILSKAHRLQSTRIQRGSSDTRIPHSRTLLNMAACGPVLSQIAENQRFKDTNAPVDLGAAPRNNFIGKFAR